MVKPILTQTYEGRLTALERAVRDARFGTSDPGVGLRFLPDGRVMLPDGRILGSHQESFSFDGPLTVSLSKPRWYPMTTERLTAVLFSLDTAGSTDTEFLVNKNASSLTPTSVDSNMTVMFSTLFLTAGNEVGVAYFNEVFRKDVDYLQIEVVAVGTGAADLNAQARFG